eukprot:jgi/Botrbrau1/4922/Bobra.0122s0004.1
MTSSLAAARLSSKPCCSYTIPPQPLWRCYRSRHKTSRTTPLQLCCSVGTAQDSARVTEALALTVAPPEIEGENPVDGDTLRAETERRIGVLLLNLGGPDRLEDVQPFLKNLFADDSIIRLPSQVKFLQEPLASLISYLRAPKSRAGYRKIGGFSPLRSTTNKQAQALEQGLQAKGLNAKVYVGMRYWKPFIEEAMDKVKEDEITDLVALPLYPQFSISTSGSSLRLLQQILQKDSYLKSMHHVVIPAWYNSNKYLEALANGIEKSLLKVPPEYRAGTVIFFSAHGVPKSYVEEDGDPYREEMENCVSLVLEKLQKKGIFNPWTLAYQSRVGPVEWLQPYTDNEILRLAAKGTESLVVVPISFVSDHIETLEEMDVEYRELAESNGIDQWVRVPALGTDPLFIEALVELVEASWRDAKRVELPKDVFMQPQLGKDGIQEETGAASYIGPETFKKDNICPPQGSVTSLLSTYDHAKKLLPAPYEGSGDIEWVWGFTRSAEIWNGRVAMLGLLGVLACEVLFTTGPFTWLRDHWPQ